MASSHPAPASPRRAALGEGAGEALRVALPQRLNPAVVMRGLALVAFGAAAAFGAMGLPSWLVPAGVGLFLSATFFTPGEPILREVVGAPREGTVALVPAAGEAVLLARGAIDAAVVTTHTSRSSDRGTSTTYGVALAKRDGGSLALATFGGSRDAAEACVAELERLLAAVPAIAEADRDVAGAALRRLQQSPRIEVSRETSDGGGYRAAAGEALVVSWSLRHPVRRVLFLPAVVGGVTAVIAGFTTSVGLRGVGIAAAVSLVVALGLHLRSVARRIRVTVDGQHLRIEEVGGARATDKALPLEAVQAVDVAWSGPLMVRVDEANAEIGRLRRLAEERPSGMGLLSVLRSVMSLLRGTMVIDTGALPFVERHDLEVVLGAEVAERSHREAGTL